MTQCNSLNITLSNLQRNKLKSGIKIGTDVALNEILLVILIMGLICHINYC